MGKLLRLLIVSSIPVFVFLNVYQTFLYQQLQQSVAVLENQEQTWLENNKRIIAGIAVLASPARIDQIAKTSLHLTQRWLIPVLRIEAPASAGGNNG